MHNLGENRYSVQNWRDLHPRPRKGGYAARCRVKITLRREPPTEIMRRRSNIDPRETPSAPPQSIRDAFAVLRGKAGDDGRSVFSALICAIKARGSRHGEESLCDVFPATQLIPCR